MLGESKEEFIEKNLGLVHSCAKQFRNSISVNSSVDFEDLVGIGAIGLMKAYNNFNHELGYRFSTYAVPMIRGEIQRFLRDGSDPIRFSRSIKQNYNKIVSLDLLEEDVNTIQERLNLSKKEVEDAFMYHKHRLTMSLNHITNNGGGDGSKSLELEDKVGTEVDFDERLVIQDFLELLDGKNKQVIKLRLKGLTQSEIATIVGVSQVQVSRIIKKAREKLEYNL